MRKNLETSSPFQLSSAIKTRSKAIFIVALLLLSFAKCSNPVSGNGYDPYVFTRGDIRFYAEEGTDRQGLKDAAFPPDFVLQGLSADVASWRLVHNISGAAPQIEVGVDGRANVRNTNFNDIGTDLQAGQEHVKDIVGTLAFANDGRSGR